MSNDAIEPDWNRPVPDVEVDLDQLDDDDDLLLFGAELFSGIAVSRHPGGGYESRRPYLNGATHGLCRWWHRNGQLSEEWMSFRGMGHGWATSWHPNGQVKKRTYAEFGRPLEWVEYDEAGNVTKRGSNRDNPLTSEWIAKSRRRFPDAP